MSQKLSPLAAGPSGSAEPNPASLWFNLHAYQRTRALCAAIELELFTAIGDGLDTIEALAERCRASARGLRILCDYLTVIGLLAKEKGRYRLVPDSAAFLDRRSPAYLGTIARFLNAPELMSAFDNLAETVRRGSTLMKGAGVAEREHPLWIEFARSMAPLVAPAAEFVGDMVAKDARGELRVLDIAAGHGLFGIAIAKRHARAEIVALDWPNVLRVARENAEAAGVKARYRLIPGDAMEADFGAGFDLVLVTNLFHHFDKQSCASLIRKIYACLKPAGRAITLEFVANEDRVSPPIPATFSLIMLALTPAGDAYTFQEFDQMFRAAGFQRNDILQVPESPQQVIVSYR